MVHVWCTCIYAFIQLYKYVSHIYTYPLSHYLIGSAILFLLPANENFDKLIQTPSSRNIIYEDYFLWSSCIFTELFHWNKIYMHLSRNWYLNILLAIQFYKQISMHIANLACKLWRPSTGCSHRLVYNSVDAFKSH